MAMLQVLSPGALTTVQDLGRVGWRRYGVPRAGVLNADWMRIANRLAGNPDDHPVLEYFVAGPTLKAVDAPVRVACAGDVQLTLLREGARSALDSWRSLTLLPGDELRLGQPRNGRVGYVAVAGLQVVSVLGSASTYTRAGLGGVDGRALAAGDRLQAGAQPLPAPGTAPAERVLRRPPVSEAAPIRVVPGPQDDHFDEAARAVFLGASYRVSREADRMGVRLEGPVLQHRPDKGADIVSDAVLPGSVQVPGNGQPIVLLADGQTMGGYPKIATVISADLARLACAPVGAAVQFQAVTVDEAEALARKHEAQLQQLLAAIEPLTLVDGVDLTALYEGNLVSAMVDALDPPHP
jgi:5-oxoprolinase (ATP-hydrolysing) subunit C